MAPQKLSDSDKQTILTLYRHPEETTSTLASRYGVSNTTISRILKQGLSEREYETLVQQKRGGLSARFQLFASESSEPSEPSEPFKVATPPVPDFELSPPEPESPAPRLTESKPKPQLRELPAPQRRKREGTAIAAANETATFEAQPLTKTAEIDGVEAKIAEMDNKNLSSATQIPLLEFSAAMEDQVVKPQPDQNYGLEATPRVAETLAEDLLNEEEDFDDLEEDLEELDDDLDDEEDDDSFEAAGDLQDFAAVHIQSKEWVNVLPLSEAPVPKIFYLVVDRASELITRPLRDFADLGQIPDEENQEKTLPIFDNHRVARRFSRRMQRVVKVPDGRMLQKVGPYLQAKGITRLLIDGQVYSI